MFIDVQPALVKVAGYVPPPAILACRNLIVKSESAHGPEPLAVGEFDLQYIPVSYTHLTLPTKLEV